MIEYAEEAGDKIQECNRRGVVECSVRVGAVEEDGGDEGESAGELVAAGVEVEEVEDVGADDRVDSGPVVGEVGLWRNRGLIEEGGERDGGSGDMYHDDAVFINMMEHPVHDGVYYCFVVLHRHQCK